MKWTRSVVPLLALAALAPAALSRGGEPAPLAGLPPWMRVLLTWGQRPEWERDSRHLLFMEKAFGDAYRIDVETGAITPLTTHFFHDGFDRVLVLANGDYLLTGTRDFEAKDPWKTRHRLEMFVLDRSLTKPALSLGEWCDEGPAVSRSRMHLAWTAPGQRDMYEADLVYADGKPSLANKRLVLSYADRPQTERLETQDFRPPDEKELLFSCYSGTAEEPFYFSDACGIDLASGRVTNYTRTPEQYDEPENVFPDGRYTLVESDRHGVNKKWKIDIYRLALDGSNRADRMTFFDSVGGPYHGSNPVVSPDGRLVAVQLGIHGMGAGQGRGLLLVDLAAWERSALAAPAAPEAPPVLATKALRVELTGTAEALWRFVPRSGAPAQAFAAPVFPLDGRPVVAALAGLHRVGDPAVLPNGVFEHVFRGTLRDDPSLGLEIRFRLSEDGPILRFRYRLTSTRPRAFTRAGREDELTLLGASFAGFPEAREVRLSEFVELFHSYTLSERDVPDSHFEAGLGAMGPILAATDGKRTLLLAYEHGSQAPDAFLRFDLAPGRRASLRAVKGSYWQGLIVDAEHPYDTVWMQAGLVAGDLDWTAEAYRSFARNELSPNPETRVPRVHYNTWNFQERNKHWNGKPYLESMNAGRMLAEIDVAARMGIETFVLDTGWYEKTGDWAVSRTRFPEGLDPLKAKLDAHGMRLGLWFNPTAAAVSSRLGLAHVAHRMSWKGESKARPVWETEESYPMCLVSPWGEAFLEELVRLHRETGLAYYKWDAVGQYGCDAPGHGHGTEANTPQERADAYAFRIGLRLAEIAERLAERVPGAVVDFDVTEGGRAVGLAFLTAGRYFLVNNGPYYQNYDMPIDPEKDNWNLFFHKGPARTWITRSTYGYDKWIPAELFLTHYFPDDPEDAQIVGIASLILGHNGIWGDLLSLSSEGVARFGRILGFWRQVRDSIAVASPVRQGAVGGSGEVHEKIEHETGRGAIVLFSTASGRQRYVSEHPVVREHWATPGTSVTLDARGRAIVDTAFERPGAAIVFFGARPDETRVQ